ncbi:hypothetical protein NPX13_g2474 [Xylaria arbuscula]|uniref:Uncharacterized protein n=1 Tax=Xylaria arbuscula TaxID=114810 RepID=A0A9W8NK03_9PEZI|nr:hypothetical protein NPX13_g2474 [Xylaria arbuscula]
MSFGSTKPTLKSQTALQLQWDCSQNRGAISQLVDSWIAVSDGTRQGSGSSPVLDEIEQHTIGEILQMETSEVTKKIESLLKIDLAHFIRVRSQLLSLLVAWEQAILEKKRYSEEGLHTGGDMSQLSPHQFLVLFQIVFHRARVGLTSLPSSAPNPAGNKRTMEPDSAPDAKRARFEGAAGQTPATIPASNPPAPAGVKRSIEPDSPVPAKRARLGDGDGNGDGDEVGTS